MSSLADEAVIGPVAVPKPGVMYVTDEVAAFYRTTPSTIRHWRAIGFGPACFKAGKRYLYRGEDLLAWTARSATNVD